MSLENQGFGAEKVKLKKGSYTVDPTEHQSRKVEEKLEKKVQQSISPEISTAKKRIENNLRVSDLSTALESWDYKHTPQESFILRFSIDANDFKPIDKVWKRLIDRGYAPKSFANLGAEEKGNIPVFDVEQPNNSVEKAKQFEYYMTNAQSAYEDMMWLVLEISPMTRF